MGTEGDRGLEIHESNGRVLKDALTRLRDAEHRLHQQTMPQTPLGRPRAFKIACFYWPVQVRDLGSFALGILGHEPWSQETSSVGPMSYEFAVSAIRDWTGNQPRRIWRVVRQINAVAAWCAKRAEGRKRAAMEILRQQSPWVNKIASEVLVEELASRHVCRTAGTFFEPHDGSPAFLWPVPEDDNLIQHAQEVERLTIIPEEEEI